MNKEKIKDFEKHFDSERLKRGRDYFESGLIKSVIIQNNLIKATVEGNSLYRVKINLDNEELTCNCPDDTNCKHLAAVFYYLRSNKFKDINKVIKNLKKKDKKELIKIIETFLTYNQNLTTLLTDNTKNIDKLIRKLWLKYEDELPYFYDKFDYVLETISSQKNKLKPLRTLIYRLMDLCDHGWNENGELDNCFEDAFELLNQEFKKISKNKKKEIKKEIEYRLQGYDYLLETLD